ncbi:MAG TPA: cupin domain-containing protein [Rhizomicrobium sp.]|jgi:mannose-6-phosphate isomerase-like protein (cupin superfamily)|nr:cupin domain-containing protein [Rhizomicrobium sp.]
MHKPAMAALVMMAILPRAALSQTPAQATAPAAGDKNITAWAAKPATLLPYTPPNRLVYRLADILAAHKGKQSWAQSVVLSRDFVGQWISMAPGEKTKTVFYADDRVFWEVQAGQMRVTIQGQDPFIASKGFLVQVPKRLAYSLETVGDAPVLRFEVRPAGEPPQYPITETPTPEKGVQYVKAVYTGHGDYDKVNHPYIDFQKQIVQGGEKIGVWVRDDHTYVTILRSEKGLPTPPPTEWGHFHENFPEFWLIVEGTQQFLVEGEKLVTVHDGDLVATPMGRWHRAEPFGDGPSTRLAFIPRPDNLHWYQPGQGGD